MRVYDGSYNAKCSATSTITAGNGAGYQKIMIPWACNYPGSAPPEWVNVDSMPEFQALKNAYTQYRVVGVKLTLSLNNASSVQLVAADTPGSFNVGAIERVDKGSFQGVNNGFFAAIG